MDAAEYCRAIETHLCQRNGGHLIRVVGPAFDCVQRWIEMGIPFKVACQGIDRHVERVHAKGERRRPVRLEFCDADVRDAFDAWRRAIGLTASALATARRDDVPDEAPPARRRSLPRHIEGAIARLTALRTGAGIPAAWNDALEDATRRLDALLATARRARGDARGAVIEALSAIDRDLLTAASRLAPAEARAAADADAAEDLAPYRGRLTDEAFAAALERGRAQALRARLGLPQIGVD